MIIAAILMISFPIRYMHIGRLMSRSRKFLIFTIVLVIGFVFTPYFGHAALGYLILYVFSPLYTWRISPDIASQEHLEKLSTSSNKHPCRIKSVDTETTSESKENSEDRLVAPESQLGEQFDQSLRPQRLQDYIGQNEIKENLHVFIGAAIKRGHALDHVLLSGPPGLGKTTLANIFAREMEVQLRSTSGPVIERQGDLAAILTNLDSGSILFIDEIHRLNRVVEEVLYGAMEDFTLDIIIGEGPGARTVKIDLPHFTLVGATTRAGLLSSPLRERFGIQFRLNFYDAEDLKTIILRAASLLGIEIVEEASLELARRARGTPRIANRLLKRCRDFADMETSGVITLPLVERSLERMRIDLEGLDQMDRHILETIIKKFGGGPVGLSTLSAAVSDEKETIEDVYEPFLLLKGFLQRTQRGRVATERAYQHLEISASPSISGRSFLKVFCGKLLLGASD